jgi:hypothetical protein
MEIIGLLAQIPLVGIFVYFVIISNRNHAGSVQRNHEEWRSWLVLQRNSELAWMAEQNETWRRWQDTRDNLHIQAMETARQEWASDRHELMETLKHLDQQTGQLIELLRSWEG